MFGQDTDIYWDIEEILDDLRNEVDAIFEKAKGPICSGFHKIKYDLQNERYEREDAEVREFIQDLVNSSEWALSQTDDYLRLLIVILQNTRWWYDEGIPNIDEFPSDSDAIERVLISFEKIQEADFDFVDLVGCFQDQCCQKFR